MTKRALVIVVVAALSLGGAAAVVASSISDSSDEPVHTLQGGEVHTGEMPPTDTNGGSTGDQRQDGGAGGGQSENDMGNMDGMSMGD